MYVMVYGTLMKGFVSNSLLESSSYIGKARTKGCLYHLSDGYPAMVHGHGWVYGEVYDVDGETLEALDAYEDYFGEYEDNLYNRTKVEAILEDHTKVKVDIYIYANEENAKEMGIPVHHGCWMYITN